MKNAFKCSINMPSIDTVVLEIALMILRKHCQISWFFKHQNCSKQGLTCNVNYYREVFPIDENVFPIITYSTTLHHPFTQIP